MLKLPTACYSKRLQRLRKEASTDTTVTMELMTPNHFSSRRAKNEEEINTSIATHKSHDETETEATKNRRAEQQREIAELKRKGMVPRRRLKTTA